MDLDAPVADEVSRLYALAPEGFVAARNATAKSWKKAGRSEDAALVAALRKPSVVEDAVNRVAHAAPDVVDRWHRAMVAADDAQSATIGGANADALRHALAELRSATSALVDAAVEALGDATKRTAIESLVRATTLAGAAQLRRGVLGSATIADAGLFAGAPMPPPRAARRSPSTHATVDAAAAPDAGERHPSTDDAARPTPDPQVHQRERERERRAQLDERRTLLEQRCDATAYEVEVARTRRDTAAGALTAAERDLEMATRELEQAERAQVAAREELEAIVEQLP